MASEKNNHLRARSLPASISSFHRPQLPSSSGSRTPKTADDVLNIKNYWRDFEVDLVEANSIKYSKIKNFENYEKYFKFRGIQNSFFGFENFKAEQSLFFYSLKMNERKIEYFFKSLVIIFLMELFLNREYEFFSFLSLLCIVLSISLTLLFKFKVLRNKLVVIMVLLLLSFLESLQQVTNFDCFTFENIIFSFEILKVFGIILYLILGSGLFFGLSPFSLSLVTGIMVFFCKIPLLHWALVSEPGLEQILVSLIFMYFAVCTFLFCCFHSFKERQEFRELVCQVETKMKINAINELISSMQQNPTHHRGVGGSSISLPEGAAETAISTFVKNSLVDSYMEAFSSIQTHFSVRVQPSLLTLIDTCVSAMAMGLKKTTNWNSNWIEFFTNDGDVSESPALSERRKNRIESSLTTVAEKFNVGSPSTGKKRRHSATLDFPNSPRSKDDDSFNFPVQLKARSNSVDKLMNFERQSITWNICNHPLQALMIH